jgi:hypothetical protein
MAELSATVLDALTPHLEEGEQALVAEVVVPASGAKGAGVGIGAAIGNVLARRGSVDGEPGTRAADLPRPATDAALLVLTDRRVGLWPDLSAGGHAEPVWTLPRGEVAGIEPRPRAQLLARFRLRFADGSALAYMTMRRAAVDRLAGELGDQPA